MFISPRDAEVFSYKNLFLLNTTPVQSLYMLYYVCGILLKQIDLNMLKGIPRAAMTVFKTCLEDSLQSYSTPCLSFLFTVMQCRKALTAYSSIEQLLSFDFKYIIWEKCEHPPPPPPSTPLPITTCIIIFIFQSFEISSRI